MWTEVARCELAGTVVARPLHLSSGLAGVRKSEIHSRNAAAFQLFPPHDGFEHTGAQMCLQKFDAVPEASHHRVSVRFLSANGSLRADLERVANGGDMTDRLNRELVAFEVAMLAACSLLIEQG